MKKTWNFRKKQCITVHGFELEYVVKTWDWNDLRKYAFTQNNMWKQKIKYTQEKSVSIVTVKKPNCNELSKLFH